MVFVWDLVKMHMFDIINNSELTKAFVTLIIIFIVCVAWWTTGITEPPHHIRTIFLVERRRSNRSNLTTHVESASIVATADTPLEAVDQPTINARSESSVATSTIEEENKPPEASTSTTDTRTNLISNNNHNQTSVDEDVHVHVQNANERSVDEEEETREIIRIMDADPNVIRQRRLAFLENRQQRGTTRNAQHGRAANVQETQPKATNETSDRTAPSQLSESNIRIKLKYLNDELKLVEGRLEEHLGDFKRRHFETELAANQFVRLIFNGQVLQSDHETLQGCGMFDNCVVHCLVHQQRRTGSAGGESLGEGAYQRGNAANTNASTNNNNSSNNNNNNQGRDWDFGNLLFMTVSLLLVSAWYFRYEYAHLYTVTATVALVAITGIFAILLVGLYFPDQEPQPRIEIRT